MAFKTVVSNESIRKIILVLIALPLVASSNIDCSGKAFHCVNSTHFMICVDLGNGVSSTIDDFIIPCPPSTVCQETNHFECEFPRSTTLPPITESSVPSELKNSDITATTDTSIIFTTANKIISEVLSKDNDLNTVSKTTLQDESVTTNKPLKTVKVKNGAFANYTNIGYTLTTAPDEFTTNINSIDTSTSTPTNIEYSVNETSTSVLLIDDVAFTINPNISEKNNDTDKSSLDYSVAIITNTAEPDQSTTDTFTFNDLLNSFTTKKVITTNNVFALTTESSMVENKTSIANITFDNDLNQLITKEIIDTTVGTTVANSDITSTDTYISETVTETFTTESNQLLYDIASGFTTQYLIEVTNIENSNISESSVTTDRLQESNLLVDKIIEIPVTEQYAISSEPNQDILSNEIVNIHTNLSYFDNATKSELSLTDNSTILNNVENITTIAKTRNDTTNTNAITLEHYTTETILSQATIIPNNIIKNKEIVLTTSPVEITTSPIPAAGTVNILNQVTSGLALDGLITSVITTKLNISEERTTPVFVNEPVTTISQFMISESNNENQTTLFNIESSTISVSSTKTEPVIDNSQFMISETKNENRPTSFNIESSTNSVTSTDIEPASTISQFMISETNNENQTTTFNIESSTNSVTSTKIEPVTDISQLMISATENENQPTTFNIESSKNRVTSTDIESATTKSQFMISETENENQTTSLNIESSTNTVTSTDIDPVTTTRQFMISETKNENEPTSFNNESSTNSVNSTDIEPATTISQFTISQINNEHQTTLFNIESSTNSITSTKIEPVTDISQLMISATENKNQPTSFNIESSTNSVRSTDIENQTTPFRIESSTVSVTSTHIEPVTTVRQFMVGETNNENQTTSINIESSTNSVTSTNIDPVTTISPFMISKTDNENQTTSFNIESSTNSVTSTNIDPVTTISQIMISKTNNENQTTSLYIGSSTATQTLNDIYIVPSENNDYITANSKDVTISEVNTTDTVFTESDFVKPTTEETLIKYDPIQSTEKNENKYSFTDFTEYKYDVIAPTMSSVFGNKINNSGKETIFEKNATELVDIIMGSAVRDTTQNVLEQNIVLKNISDSTKDIKNLTFVTESYKTTEPLSTINDITNSRKDNDQDATLITTVTNIPIKIYQKSTTEFYQDSTTAPNEANLEVTIVDDTYISTPAINYLDGHYIVEENNNYQVESVTKALTDADAINQREYDIVTTVESQIISSKLNKPSTHIHTNEAVATEISIHASPLNRNNVITTTQESTEKRETLQSPATKPTINSVFKPYLDNAKLKVETERTVDDTISYLPPVTEATNILINDYGGLGTLKPLMPYDVFTNIPDSNKNTLNQVFSQNYTEYKSSIISPTQYIANQKNEFGGRLQPIANYDSFGSILSKTDLNTKYDNRNSTDLLKVLPTLSESTVNSQNIGRLNENINLTETLSANTTVGDVTFNKNDVFIDTLNSNISKSNQVFLQNNTEFMSSTNELGNTSQQTTNYESIGGILNKNYLNTKLDNRNITDLLDNLPLFTITTSDSENINKLNENINSTVTLNYDTIVGDEAFTVSDQRIDSSTAPVGNVGESIINENMEIVDINNIQAFETTTNGEITDSLFDVVKDDININFHLQSNNSIYSKNEDKISNKHIIENINETSMDSINKGFPTESDSFNTQVPGKNFQNTSLVDDIKVRLSLDYPQNNSTQYVTVTVNELKSLKNKINKTNVTEGITKYTTVKKSSSPNQTLNQNIEATIIDDMIIDTSLNQQSRLHQQLDQNATVSAVINTIHEIAVASNETQATLLSNDGSLNQSFVIDQKLTRETENSKTNTLNNTGESFNEIKITSTSFDVSLDHDTVLNEKLGQIVEPSETTTMNNTNVSFVESQATSMSSNGSLRQSLVNDQRFSQNEKTRETNTVNKNSAKNTIKKPDVSFIETNASVIPNAGSLKYPLTFNEKLVQNKQKNESNVRENTHLSPDSSFSKLPKDSMHNKIENVGDDQKVLLNHSDSTSDTTVTTTISTESTVKYVTQNLNIDSTNSFDNGQKVIDPFCFTRNRGRYADRKDCTKFYICIGKTAPIVGKCPANTVFSEIKKQCIKNKSHCVRGNEFQCLSDGRFSDILNNNAYYICIKRHNTFIRFKFQCQNGYYLNKITVRCTKQLESISQSSTSSDNSNSEKSVSEGMSTETKKSENNKKESKSGEDFECKNEGKYADNDNCRKFYVCTKTTKSEFRMRRKSCDSDEVFHKDKKKCVDADSYEC